MQWIFDHFNFPPRANILEIGAGPAALWRENADRLMRDWKVTLSNFSEGMLLTARENTENLAYSFHYEYFPVEDIPHADHTFDAVIANHMLYYADPLDEGLREIRRVLKPGGTLYAATNGSSHFREIDEIVIGFGGNEKLIQSIIGRFNLDNGPGLIGKHFENVNCFRQDNALVVDEPEAITAYILSGTRADIMLQDAPALTAFVANLMQKNGGRITITKDAGLMIGF